MKQANKRRALTFYTWITGKSDLLRTKGLFYLKFHYQTYLQNRNRLTEVENKFTVTKGVRGWGRDK